MAGEDGLSALLGEAFERTLSQPAHAFLWSIIWSAAKRRPVWAEITFHHADLLDRQTANQAFAGSPHLPPHVESMVG